MTSTELRGHELKVFSVRIVDVWNGLPAALLRCNNVETFKRKLDCHFKDWGYE